MPYTPSGEAGSPSPKWLHCGEKDPYGAWRSPVARLLWEQEVPGSNPGAPTVLCGYMQLLSQR